MVSIINRTAELEDQIKIIDKDAKNKFKWSWLQKFVTVELYKQLKYVHVYIVNTLYVKIRIVCSVRCCLEF